MSRNDDPIQVLHHRCARTAQGVIRGPEVGDGGDARGRRDDRGLPDEDAGRIRPVQPQVHEVRMLRPARSDPRPVGWLLVDRLAIDADAQHGRRVDARLLDERLRHALA